VYSLAAAAAARSTTFRLTLKRVKHNAEPLQLRQITFATLAQYHFYSGLDDGLSIYNKTQNSYGLTVYKKA
jgi:hypothetical protein